MGLMPLCGCVNRNPYNPYPVQYPQQYQAYPYAAPLPAQPGQPIQTSPMVGQPLQGAMQPGYGVPGTFAPGQQPPYLQQPLQAAPQPAGYYGQPSQQGASPLLFGR